MKNKENEKDTGFPLFLQNSILLFLLIWRVMRTDTVTVNDDDIFGSGPDIFPLRLNLKPKGYVKEEEGKRMTMTLSKH